MKKVIVTKWLLNPTNMALNYHIILSEFGMVWIIISKQCPSLDDIYMTDKNSSLRNRLPAATLGKDMIISWCTTHIPAWPKWVRAGVETQPPTNALHTKLYIQSTYKVVHTKYTQRCTHKVHTKVIEIWFCFKFLI